MRIDAIQASFVRALGPELGSQLGQTFSDPAQIEQQLGLLLAQVGMAFPKAGLQPAAAQRRPRAFSPSAASGRFGQNPLAAFNGPQAMGAAGTNGLKDLVGQLDQMIALLSPQASATQAAAGSAPSAYTAAAAPVGGSEVRATGGGGGWGNIDSMMQQAEQLMQSDNQSDQLKGQMLMQRAMRLFEMISKMMEQQSQLASKAIQAIR